MSTVSVKVDKKIYRNSSDNTIDNLSFTAKHGEFVAIVGPSGTGKTTLLNIIAGIDDDFEGEVNFKADNSTDKFVDDRPELSFMFQDSRLLPWLTVEQNIELVLDKKSLVDTIKTKTRILRSLDKVGLGDVTDKFPGQLSGGMKRRVSMVRAFINSPQLLLMDEPFQSLDEPTANELRIMLLELWRDTQATVLFVTHSLREALALADRVIFLSKSPAKIIYDFPVDLSRPRQLEDKDIGALHMNLMEEFPNLLSGSLEKSLKDSVQAEEDNNGYTT